MKVLIAGLNSYIAKNLIPTLLNSGHEVICQVRDKNHFLQQDAYPGVTVIKGDLLRERSMEPIPYETDVAFYLVNSLSQTSGFAGLEALSASNFINALNNTACKQVITISEICGSETSAALSRQHIEAILADGQAALTVFKTGLVIGPGSIALEMLHELTRKETVVIPSKWAKANTQPIAVADVISYMILSMLNKATYNVMLEMGGPEVMTFKELVIKYTSIYKQRTPAISTVPNISFKIVSHWLNLLTPLSYPSAQALLESLEFDSICENKSLSRIIPIELTPFDTILQEVCLNSPAN